MDGVLQRATNPKLVEAVERLRQSSTPEADCLAIADLVRPEQATAIRTCRWPT